MLEIKKRTFGTAILAISGAEMRKLDGLSQNLSKLCRVHGFSSPELGSVGTLRVLRAHSS